MSHRERLAWLVDDFGNPFVNRGVGSPRRTSTDGASRVAPSGTLVFTVGLCIFTSFASSVSVVTVELLR